MMSPIAARASGPARPRNWTWAVLGAAVALALFAAFRPGHGDGVAPEPAIERQGRQFVLLARTLGRLAPSEVDSDFAPEDIAPPKDGPPPTFPGLKADLADLAGALHAGAPGADDPRRLRLADRTERLRALADIMTSGARPPFDEEARRLYGLEPPSLDGRTYVEARAALDRLLPGDGSLTARVERFRDRFVIPEKLRPAVFARALAECRRRTLLHWRLPGAERLDVEWTSDVDAAWHRYRGNYHSVLRINPQAVAFLGSAVDVACHEAYPGHHTQFVLSEAAMVGAGGPPVEDRIVLLRSPASVLREGMAEYGVSLVFPAAERLAFERDVLFPLIGHPPEEAERFERVRQLLYELAPAAMPILRAYRDRRTGADAAADALDREALIASPRALLSFVDGVGAYTVGYTSAREQARAFVEARGATGEARWSRLACLIRSADDAPLDASTHRLGPPACEPARNEVKK